MSSGPSSLFRRAIMRFYAWGGRLRCFMQSQVNGSVGAPVRVAFANIGINSIANTQQLVIAPADFVTFGLQHVIGGTSYNGPFYTFSANGRYGFVFPAGSIVMEASTGGNAVLEAIVSDLEYPRRYFGLCSLNNQGVAVEVSWPGYSRKQFEPFPTNGIVFIFGGSNSPTTLGPLVFSTSNTTDVLAMGDLRSVGTLMSGDQISFRVIDQ